MYICPECSHEWSRDTVVQQLEEEGGLRVPDANVNRLKDGDTVTVIKDLKVKGASSSLKVGTKVKNIRLVEGDHNIDCSIEGFGAMKLNSEFVRKAWRAVREGAAAGQAPGAGRLAGDRQGTPRSSSVRLKGATEPHRF